MFNGIHSLESWSLILALRREPRGMLRSFLAVEPSSWNAMSAGASGLSRISARKCCRWNLPSQPWSNRAYGNDAWWECPMPPHGDQPVASVLARA
jgi:hypothetical protein